MPSNKILFIDILTVPQFCSYNDLSTNDKALWKWKSEIISPKEADLVQTYDDRAGIYAEFGKLGGFAIGYQSIKSNDLRIKTFIDNSEVSLLTTLEELLTTSFRTYKLCAHHGKEFDYPFLARRMIVNEIKLPQSLQKLKSKPWNHPHLDTMDLWKFGDRKSFTPLSLLSNTLGDDSLSILDPAHIGKLYYDNQFDQLEQRLTIELNALAKVYNKLKET
jgi:3'-5' exonuclease